MKLQIIISIVVLMFFVHPNILLSQTNDAQEHVQATNASFLIGGFAGLNYNVHSGAFTTGDGQYACCGYEKGIGIGFIVGAKMLIPLIDEISLSPRINYENRNGKFTQTKNDIPILGAGNTLEYWNVEEKLNASVQTFTVDLFGSYPIPVFDLYVIAGPSFGFILSKNFETTETILGPTGVKYNDGSTSKTFSNQIVDVNSVLFSLRGGIGMMFEFSDGYYLNPEVLYGFPLNKFSKDYEWKISGIQFSIGLMMKM